MKKSRDLIIIALIYILAFAIGFACCLPFENVILRFFIFDSVATVVTFIFSVVLKNSSVYDAYWSLTPMVMSVWLFVIYNSWSVYQIIFLICFNIWSIRLTLNWVSVFTDFSYEDWRYRKYRDETPKIFWPVVNFFGIHYMPTLIVFAGMLPMFSVAEKGIGAWSVVGDAIMLLGVGFEFFADRQMHRFLDIAKSGNMSVCEEGLWKYSRHPNYLGEITFWLGVFISAIVYDVEHWHYVIGFVSVAILFNVVSIPLMEKRQTSRRPEYVQYKKRTSRLLILPKRK